MTGRRRDLPRLSEARIGYTPVSVDLRQPSDRRRFAFYAARRGLTFERAVPGDDLDLVVLTSASDILRWRHTPPRTKLVYDLIDSYLAQPRTALRSVGRGVAKRLTGETSVLTFDYRRAIEEMCRRADAVVCTTVEQRRDILALCPNVHVVLDHHGDDALAVKYRYAASFPFRLVWEGLPHTLPAFATIAPALRELQVRNDAELHIVTDLEFYQYARAIRRRRTALIAAKLFDRFALHAWSPELLSTLVPTCDLAIIPANLRDPFSAGKPENKLLLMWRLGLPTVTAATPAYRRAMGAAGLDLLCATPQDWMSTLQRLIDDEDERARAGQAGREYVGAHHTTESLLHDWDRVFASVGFDPS